MKGGRQGREGVFLAGGRTGRGVRGLLQGVRRPTGTEEGQGQRVKGR